MKLVKKVVTVLYKFLFNPTIRFQYLDALGFYRHLSDEVYLRKRYKLIFNKELNLENPQTFNEKLQWLKLFDRKPLYTTLVDKAAVKDYVARQIGKEYIIPTIGVWDRFEDIDFDSLPAQFVLKCTHDSGGVVICRDKQSFNKQKAKQVLDRFLRRNFYSISREWPYKNVKPRIIAEQYMEDSSTKDLKDYKFFTFNGSVKALFIATDRQTVGTETKFDFFDAQYNHLNFRNGHPNATECPPKPCCFEEMKLLAAKLSEGIPHVRVDFYEVNGKVFFGEMTFFHWGGLVPFEPEEWDRIFGEWINLPIEKCDYVEGGCEK